MRDIKNKLTSGKNTKKIKNRRGKSFGYQVLGFGAGGGAAFAPLVATGGTVSTVGDYKVHKFTSPGTFQVTEAGSPDAMVVEYLIVAGGGGMGYGYGGAGGAGGYRAAGCGPSPLQAPAAAVSVTSYPISVGAAGGGGPVRPVGPYAPASSGSSSDAINLTAAGGGYGGSTPGSAPGGPGGSGGGAGGPSGGSGGTGNTPPVSPPQGNNGQSGTPEGTQGGGAGAAGGNPRDNITGVINSIDGSPRYYSCGGRSGPSPHMSPRSNSGFGGKCQGQSGCSGIVIIRYRLVEA